eukprot:3822036-Heterocapsa_arctica.AAC.1
MTNNTSTLQYTEGTTGGYSLIRVDSQHYSAPLAIANYEEITADNVAVLCVGQEYMMYQAEARSAGLVVGGGLGLCRGMANLHAPSRGCSQELALELATSKNADGTESGIYRPLKHAGDDGLENGEVRNEISYVMNINTLIESGTQMFKTAGGSYTILSGGVDMTHICAIMFNAERSGNCAANSLAITDFLRDPDENN